LDKDWWFLTSSPKELMFLAGCFVFLVGDGDVREEKKAVYEVIEQAYAKILP
jgi:hypothetical protein